MEELFAECAAHGYDVGAVGPEAEPEVVQQLRRLMLLSRQVEAASMRLATLQAHANYEDLVNPMALERKAALLREAEERAATVVRDKDKILAHVQRNRARRDVLAVEASKQEAVVELFEAMSREGSNSEAILSHLEWGTSGGAAGELVRAEEALAALTLYQGRYQRTAEASEELTAALEAQHSLLVAGSPAAAPRASASAARPAAAPSPLP